MIFRQLFDNVSSTYTYLIASRRGGEALIIDPVIDRVERYLMLIEELDLKLVKAIETSDPAAEGALTPKVVATCTEMTAELTVEVLQPLGIAYVVILNWLKAAMETFEAAEAKRVADEEAKKAAAAEAAAA